MTRQNRRLRIVHVTATPNGAPWMVALAREQSRAGHDVRVILPALDGTTAAALVKEGIECHVAASNILSVSGLFARATTVLELVRLLRRLRPDVVHSHLLPSVVTARIASWIADVPIRLSTNAGPLTMESELLRPIEVGTAFADTFTIASCSYTRELFTRYGIPENQSATIYYAVDQSAFDPDLADGPSVRRALGVDHDTPLVGIVAYFYPPSDSVAVFGPKLAGRGLKGHEVLLRAIPRVLAVFPNARFALVGRGWGPDGPAYERTLKDLAAGLGIADAVLFTGERSDVPDTLAAFDVSVHPSLNDNLGGTVESLLMAKPLVVSDIRGYADTVLHDQTGLVAPAGDAEALADAILRLLGDRELGRRLGENGRAWMLKRFTLSRTVEDVEELMGRRPERAEEHYRVATMLSRAIKMPWRLLPTALEVRRVLARHRPARRLSRRIRSAGHRLLKRVSRRQVKSDKVRVAQVAAAWHDCEWLINLCRDLGRRGYDVIAIIDIPSGNLAGRLEAAGIRYYKLPMTFATGLDRTRLPAYLAMLPLAAIRMARILRRERIGIVHSHIFTSVIIARLAALMAGARHVAGISGPRHLEAALTRTVDRLTWWLDDVTIAGCRHTRDLYAQLGAGPEQLDCVYYGADAARFDPALADPARMRRELGIPGDATMIALVSHFYPPASGAQTPRHTAGRGLKGHEDFLAAVRILAPRFPAARFVIAGSAVLPAGERYRQQLIAQCLSDERLRDRVLFTGHLEDVPSLLAAADVAVQCSLTENLGGTIEALLMACPVVATRVGGMPESVLDGETGLLVPPSDPPALAAAIAWLIEHPEEAAALGRAGRQLMMERFTSERTADDVAAVYQRLGHQAGGAGQPVAAA